LIALTLFAAIALRCFRRVCVISWLAAGEDGQMVLPTTDKQRSL
jgi:hypothetical protein